MFTVRMSSGTEFGPADLDTIVQWCREGRIPRDALLYPAGGGDPKSVFAEPRLAALLAAPPTLPTLTPATSESKPRSWMPTGNPPALWGYYLAVAGLVPPLFTVLSPIALILGGIGVVRALTKPEAKGLVHAIVAIILGIGGPVLWYMAWMYFEEQF